MNEKLFYVVLSLAMITNAVWIGQKIYFAKQKETEQILLIQKTNQEVDKILEIMDSIKHKIETLENK